jgi:hypothetical protein
MKLIICLECRDVVRLIINEERTCQCGKSGGRYLEDGLNAEYWGKAIPIGFANYSLAEAIGNQPGYGKGYEFTAFVIPKQCETMKKVRR